MIIILPYDDFDSYCGMHVPLFWKKVNVGNIITMGFTLYGFTGLTWMVWFLSFFKSSFWLVSLRHQLGRRGQISCVLGGGVSANLFPLKPSNSGNLIFATKKIIMLNKSLSPKNNNLYTNHTRDWSREKFLAPTRSPRSHFVRLSVRPFGTSLSRAFNLHLSASDSSWWLHEEFMKTSGCLQDVFRMTSGWIKEHKASIQRALREYLKSTQRAIREEETNQT